MTRSELQKALKPFKEAGLVTIKLTAKTEKLQEEFDRVGSCQIGFTPIPEPEETIHPEVAEVVEPLKDTLLERIDGAEDELRMQEVIDRAGLWDELEAAWHSIPGYKDFEPIFEGNAAMGMFAELLMTEAEHDNYVRVCKEAQRIEKEFSRKALEKLVSQ